MIPQFNKIRELLAGNQPVEGRHYFYQINKNQLTKDDRVLYSKLSRFLDLPHLGLRALYAISEPDATERCEHAACLIELGAYDEGYRLLLSIPESACSEVLLQKALFYFYKRENLPQAIKLLKQYLETDNHLPEDTQIAKQTLHSLCAETNTDSPFVLLDLNLSDLEKLTVKKWGAIKKLRENPGNTKLLQDLRDLRKQFSIASRWEDVRDCDHFESLFTKNEKLFFNVYFGSQSLEFREKLLRDWRLPIEIPRFYDWHVPGKSHLTEDKGRWTFDLLMGERIGGKTPLKVGKGMHRLLGLLASDFYRPFRIAQLFTLLYPGEAYHPVNSPPRVHQILNRLRIWISKHHMPLTIEENNNHYRLVTTEGFIFRIPNLARTSDPSLIHLEKLKEVFGEKIFSAIEAGRSLGTSGRTVLRLMDKGLKSGLIVRSGRGALTRYQFISTQATYHKAA